MNKILKGAICAGLCITMFSAAGCKKRKLDPETRQLQLSIGALDENFNPFFYTSGNDGEMIGMTQISMLSIDSEGNLVCGDDWPTVVQSYSTTMYDKNNTVTTVGDTEGRTEYEFVIKDGIKFSDGEPLTIKDVLFNFYVYLDPSYTGSATMYSTDIRGLKSYRAQRNIADGSDDSGMESTFYGNANVRINNLINWSENLNTTTLTEQGQKDLARVKELFKEEITSDWTSLSSSWRESFKDTYSFTETWQAYFLQEGVIQIQTKLNSNGATEQLYNDLNGNGKRDDGEHYYTTLDDAQPGAQQEKAQHIIDEVAAATTDEKVNAFMSANNCDRTYAVEQLQREYAIDTVYKNNTADREIANVLRYWATGNNALIEFAGQERTEYYDNLIKNNNGEMIIKTISGITTYKNDAGKDVLKIVINGIDPKAIYNFAIPIAPLHYYSGTYEGVDYVAEADGVTKFGVKFNDINFMRKVLQATEKNGVPVGAGAYKASTETGSADATRRTFCNNNICYFMRNDYFHTVGANLSNAKIKYVNFKVINDDALLTALLTEEIDYAKPNATPANQAQISSNSSFIDSVSYRTGGYGYVGINPKFVPEYKVRQAIMKAMDTKQTLAFYGTSLAEAIYRPMSSTSWAYPQGVTEHESIAYSTQDAEITKLVTEAGYERQNGTGIFVKRRNIQGMANARIGSTLKITFTIAGDSTEHPAYNMFCNTRDRLNNLGFDITVKHDPQALKALTSGNLAVWAAAWSSASDPDMYQVYHKDSTATSVNNWNYRNILNNSSDWMYEYNIIQDLSDKIDEARTKLERDQRTPIYRQCLDLVMTLAVELPTYQRNDLCAYNKNVIDKDSLQKNPNFNIGLFDKIWEIDYV